MRVILVTSLTRLGKTIERGSNTIHNFFYDKSTKSFFKLKKHESKFESSILEKVISVLSPELFSNYDQLNGCENYSGGSVWIRLSKKRRNLGKRIETRRYMVGFMNKYNYKGHKLKFPNFRSDQQGSLIKHTSLLYPW